MKNKGFTLIELLVVVCVISILSTIVFHEYSEYKNKLITNVYCERQPSGIDEPLVIEVDGCKK